MTYWSPAPAIPLRATTSGKPRVSKELVGLNWGLSYVDTDISDSECASYLGFDDVCEATVVASVGKSF